MNEEYQVSSILFRKEQREKCTTILKDYYPYTNIRQNIIDISINIFINIIKRSVNIMLEISVQKYVKEKPVMGNWDLFYACKFET